MLSSGLHQKKPRRVFLSHDKFIHHELTPSSFPSHIWPALDYKAVKETKIAGD